MAGTLRFNQRKADRYRIRTSEEGDTGPSFKGSILEDLAPPASNRFIAPLGAERSFTIDGGQVVVDLANAPCEEAGLVNFAAKWGLPWSASGGVQVEEFYSIIDEFRGAFWVMSRRAWQDFRRESVKRGQRFGATAHRFAGPRARSVLEPKTLIAFCRLTILHMMDAEAKVSHCEGEGCTQCYLRQRASHQGLCDRCRKAKNKRSRQSA